MTKDKAIFLGLIILVGFFLRAYKISSNFVFSGEFGTELLYVRDTVLSGKLPLVGLPTSHTWISYGPLYYWLMAFVMKVFGPEPLVGVWVGIIVGTLAIVFNYLVAKKVFSEKVALVSSALIAISPIWISFSRMARLYIFSWLIWCVFVIFLWQLWMGKVKNIFWLGFFFGLFFNFHFSPILLSPVLLIGLYLKRKFLKTRHFFSLLSAVILANLPVLIYDGRQGFSMLKSIVVWIPYRIAGFLGLYPKNNPSPESFKETLNIINEFFGKMFVLYEPFWIVFTLVFIALCGIILKRNYKNFFKDFDIFLIFSSLAGVLIGVFVHQAPPIHYFLPLFPIIPILVSMVTAEKLFRFSIICIVILLLFNLKAFSGNYLFYGEAKNATYNPDFVPYKLQRKIAEYIVSDVKSEKFTLRRVGPYDYFSEEYSQNYRYLLWLLGNEPVEKAKITYTIYEDVLRLPLSARNIQWFNNVAIVKSNDRERELR